MPRFHPQRWSSIALMVGAVAVLAAVLFGRVPSESRWASELAESAHGPSFAIVTMVLVALLRRLPHRHASVLGDYSLAVAVALLLGTLIELLQGATGRDASFGDVLRDALGALAGVGFLTLVDPRVRALPSSSPIRVAGLLVGVVSAAIAIAPLAITGAAYLQRQRSFPTLVDFNSPLSTYFLGVYSPITIERETLPSDMPGATQGAIGLHVRLDGNEGWWGLFLHEPLADWRGYDRLALDLANPTGVPLLFSVNVRDRQQIDDRQGYLGDAEIAPHSRQTRTFPLENLANVEGIAPVDTAIVSSILLSRNAANRATEFYLMRVWLE